MGASFGVPASSYSLPLREAKGVIMMFGATSIEYLYREITGRNSKEKAVKPVS